VSYDPFLFGRAEGDVVTFDLGPGAAGSDGDESETHVTFGSRELDRLFLLHAAALHAGEAVARWWFTWRANAEDVTNEPELDTLLRESLDGIAGALSADAVAVLLADETDQLVVRAATGLQPELFREVHIAPGTGMAGRVMAERRPYVVPDLPDVEVVSETLRDSGVRSLVAVPIYGGDRVIGVVHADSYQLSYFNQGDAALLSLVADRLGAAMEQVRLFEAERAARSRAESVADRLARLQTVTAALSRDLDATAIAEVVRTELSGDIDGAAVSHLVWGVDRGHLRLLSSSEGNEQVEPFATMSLDDPLPGPEVVRTGRALWFESRTDVERFEALRHARLTGEALAVVPLVLEDQVLGVMTVSYGRPRRFTDDEKLFLSLVARQVAESLHRAALRLARQRAAFANELLADVSASLGSTLELPVSLRRALTELVPRMADLAVVYLTDELGVPRRVALVHGDPETEARLAQAPEDAVYETGSVMATLVAAEGQPLLLPASGDFVTETALDEAHADRLRSLGITSAIAVPLSAGARSLGVLGLLRLESSVPYTGADLSLAAEVGERTSAAVDNALQHERRVAVARALQTSLLPPALPDVPGAEVAAAFHAASAAEVGGDFYDLFPVDDHRWVLLVGDVSGAGPAAAALTAQVRHGARVAARAGLEPEAVVAAVNATLEETTGPEWFCTMVYVELTPGSDGIDLQVICAGHLPPLLVADGRAEELEGRAPLLGVLTGARFPATRARLYPGQALVMLTDGATEARAADRARADSFFGEERVRQVLAASWGADAEGLVQALSKSVLDHASWQLHDDLAVVALRAEPAGPQNRDQ